MKVHSFYIEEAEKHGVEKAVILYNLRFWLEKNRANKANEHDGYYWTFNSAKAFAELFPYFGQRKIARLLQQLEDENVILSGCYNKRKYDRTKWYSLPEFKVENDKKYTCNACNQSFVKSDKAICEKCLKGLSEVSKGIVKTIQPIPDINTDKKPNGKPDATKGGAKKARFNPFEYEIPSFIDKELWQAYHEMREIAKKPATENACKRLVSKLTKWNKKGLDVNPAIEASLIANWTDVYEEKAVSTSQPTNKKANSDLPAWQQTYVPPTFNANDIQRPVELSEEEKKRASEQLKKARQEFLL